MMSDFIEDYIAKKNVNESFLVNFTFTYRQLYYIANYRKDNR